MSVERLEVRHKKSRGWVMPLVLVLLVAGGGYYGWDRYRTSAAASARQASARKEIPAVPVSLGVAESGSFPVNVTGLGTVQAYNTVVVRSRVDGQIETVAYQEGQSVKEGDLLVKIDARPYQAALDQALAKKKQDDSTLNNAHADLERYTKLGDYASRQQRDTQAATVNQLTAQLAADQAMIDNATTQVSYATIRAPITGVTGFRQVDVGNIVNASTQTGIVTITQVEPISVVFTEPEDRLADITAALAAGTVPVDAYSTDGRRKLSSGRLELVNNQVDTTTGTIKMKATFENKDRALWPGLSVSTRMLVRTMKDVVTVSDDAVQHGPDGLFAYVVDGDTARQQPITVSTSGSGRSVVTAGLKAGQKVVTGGQYRVQDGTRVAERPPAGQKEAAAEAR